MSKQNQGEKDYPKKTIKVDFCYYSLNGAWLLGGVCLHELLHLKSLEKEDILSSTGEGGNV